MALRAEEAGSRKAAMEPLNLFVLGVLAGAFIAFGAIFATTVGAGSVMFTTADGQVLTATLPYGVTRLLTGVVFSLGLVLVVIGGAELFTGNTLIVMAWAGGKVRTSRLLANWAIVFIANCLGAGCTAALMFYSGQYAFGAGAVGLNALAIAQGKLSLGFGQAFVLGLMCNTLVCLAVWMCYSARTTADRILTIVPPIAAFVAAGFEHSVANAYFVPVALFIKAGAPGSFWTSIGKTAADFDGLSWSAFLLHNLLPVTLGNMVGGSVMVAGVYWFIYLRPARAREKQPTQPHL
jgi:formate/nitrite transporter